MAGPHNVGDHTQVVYSKIQKCLFNPASYNLSELPQCIITEME